MSSRAAVQALIDTFGADLSPYRRALAESALTLASTLDDGAGMAAAAVARELRATLAELQGEQVEDSTDDLIFGSDLSASVRHPAQS